MNRRVVVSGEGTGTGHPELGPPKTRTQILPYIPLSLVFIFTIHHFISASTRACVYVLCLTGTLIVRRGFSYGPELCYDPNSAAAAAAASSTSPLLFPGASGMKFLGNMAKSIIKINHTSKKSPHRCICPRRCQEVGECPVLSIL